MKAITLFIILAALIITWGFWRNHTPPVIGLLNAKLYPCPSRPNCVCSEKYEDTDAVAALPLPTSNQNALDILEEVIRSFPRTEIITRLPNYLHVEFRSERFAFVDDVEFRVAPDEGVIHIRSASRVGYGDMGVNKLRVEEIRQRYIEAQRRSSTELS